MSRAAVWQALEDDRASGSPGALGALGVTYVGTSTGPDNPGTPFVVLRWGLEDMAGSPTGARGAVFLDVWAHDDTGDYGRIDAILDRCRAILLPLTHLAGADGYTLTAVNYLGKSGDLYDDGFQTATRYATYRLAMRPTAA